MTLEDKMVDGMSTEAVVSGEAAKRGASRRSILKALGIGASVATVWGGSSLAGNGWNAGVIDTLSNEKMIDMWTKMVRSRLWELSIKDAWLGGKDDLYGPFHPSTGEEAVSAGAIGVLNTDDFIASTHRGHSQLIAKGGDLNKMTAEIYFRATGYNKGYGGSMHITDTSIGILGMNGIIGVSHILAAGAAYGIQVRGTKQVAVAFGGDGSVNNGWFYDALRNAQLYKLPLIQIIENNGWQVGNPTELTNPLGGHDLATLAEGVQVPGYVVDGQDLLAVYSVVKAAVDRARDGGGPTLIEAKTYRFFDHSGWAGAKVGVTGAFGLPYRSDKDVKTWIAANDPITRFRTTLVALGVLDDAKADAILAQTQKEVDSSIEFARQSPHPAEDDGLTHVYAQGAVPKTQFFA